MWSAALGSPPSSWDTNVVTTGVSVQSAATGLAVKSATTGATVGAAGAVAGTNAPYVQLLVCQKN